MDLLASHRQGLLRQSPAPNKLFSFKQVKSVASSRRTTTMAGSGRFFVGGEYSLSFWFSPVREHGGMPSRPGRWSRNSSDGPKFVIFILIIDD